MKKIIAAIDGLKYSESTAQYAAQMTREIAGHLVGVFNESPDYHDYAIYDLAFEDAPLQDGLTELDEHDKITRAAAVAKFTETCRLAQVNSNIHRDKRAAMPQLLYESIFADLLVIDKHETFSRFAQDLPTSFIRNLLENAQCPVLVVPREFESIEKIILLYDGGPSSVYAIKMFSYLLSPFKKMPIEVLSVKPTGQDLHLPDNRLMKEFMKRHFPQAAYKIIQGEPASEIIKYLKNRHQDELVVLGAYQRGMVSRWLKTSMADILMTHLKTPLFIAHH